MSELIWYLSFILEYFIGFIAFVIRLSNYCSCVCKLLIFYNIDFFVEQY